MSPLRPDDELAIRRLVDTYVDGVNRRDGATWGATWAEDATWGLAGRELTGREAIVAFWSAAMARYTELVQLAPNGVVMPGEHEDSATGRWYILEQGRLTDGTEMSMAAVYHDRYVRTPDGWRFARRELELLRRG